MAQSRGSPAMQRACEIGRKVPHTDRKTYKRPNGTPSPALQQNCRGPTLLLGVHDNTTAAIRSVHIFHQGHLEEVAITWTAWCCSKLTP
jgi:hypothetical protein